MSRITTFLYVFLTSSNTMVDTQCGQKANQLFLPFAFPKGTRNARYLLTGPVSVVGSLF